MTVYGVLVALMLCAHGAEAQRSKETKARPVKLTLQATIHGISFDGPASHGLTTLNLSLADGTYVTVAAGGIGPWSEASACWKNSLEVLVMVEGKLWGAAKSGRQSFFVSAERLSIKSADRGNGAAAKQQVIIEGKAVTGQYEIEKKCSNLAIENPVAPVVVISRNAPESGIEGRINVTGRLGVTPEGKTFIEAEKIEPASAK